MKKILLISDTHSHLDDKMLKYIKDVDEVWHAGDIGDLRVTDVL
ncbi:MAG: metallophosphoesterase family protein, partial [Flavobacteriaceae bacterium]|nr:metallophosphoesterase family protein [Flavobacteriaceae bacterium]